MTSKLFPLFSQPSDLLFLLSSWTHAAPTGKGFFFRDYSGASEGLIPLGLKWTMSFSNRVDTSSLPFPHPPHACHPLSSLPCQVRYVVRSARQSAQTSRMRLIRRDPPTQSSSCAHMSSIAHPGQDDPPQHVSVSSPFKAPSRQEPAVGPAVGRTVGLLDGRMSAKTLPK